jgi:hypothetical protein
VGCLLHPSAKDQEGGPRIPGSGSILSHIDNWIFKPGQTLYEATAGSGKDPLNWEVEQEKAFQELKRLLTSAPTLGLPDIKRPFNLFVCEKNHTALGPWQCPVAYLSKCLDSVACVWPPCLWALTATVTLIREAEKLTLGQDINVKFPHAVAALVNGQGHKWLTSSRMAHYQGLLCENT